MARKCAKKAAAVNKVERFGSATPAGIAREAPTIASTSRRSNSSGNSSSTNSSSNSSNKSENDDGFDATSNGNDPMHHRLVVRTRLPPIAAPLLLAKCNSISVSAPVTGPQLHMADAKAATSQCAAGILRTSFPLSTL